MTRPHILRAAALALALAVAALITPHAIAAPETPPEIDLRADSASYDEKTDTTTAEGRVSAKLGGLGITTEKAVIHHNTGDIEIPGAVTFSRGNETFKGSSLKYNYKTNTGTLTAASGCFAGVNVRGESLEFAPGTITLHEASASTCGLDKPDYRIRARTAEISSSGRVKFKGIGFFLWKRRLLKLGSLSTTLGFASAPSTEPAGPPKKKKRYAGFKLSPPAAGYATIGGINVRAGLYRELAPNVNLRLRASHYFTEGTFPEAAIERTTKRAEYTIRYGKQFKENTGYSRYAGPVAVWNSPTAAVRYAARTHPGTRLIYSFDAEAGRMREKQNPRPIDRILTKLFIKYPLNPGDPVTFSIVAEGRYGVYSAWRKYRVLGSGLSMDFTLRKRHTFNFDYLHFQDNGRTFFYSDLVNTHDRLFFASSSKITKRTTAWADGEFDLDTNRTVEAAYGLTRNYKCLQFQLGWRKELKAAMFRVYLLGFPTGK